MSEDRMACLGATTRSVRTTEHMEECLACGTQIQFQLVDHPFWGFRATCARGVPEELSAARARGRSRLMEKKGMKAGEADEPEMP